MHDYKKENRNTALVTAGLLVSLLAFQRWYENRLEKYLPVANCLENGAYTMCIDNSGKLALYDFKFNDIRKTAPYLLSSSSGTDMAIELESPESEYGTVLLADDINRNNHLVAERMRPGDLVVEIPRSSVEAYKNRLYLP